MIWWRLLLVTVVCVGMTGCTSANLNDPTYNTKQLLIHDPRSNQ